ncbi:ATPase [Novosphingobium barchaimii LL02]|uniref:ATPase n=1 Tax=Novosphingobium barchaimii LL02 TaxID=1114963 RepID=A0A0J7XKJ1_9SPHN|nr:AAA family ATPase [Novosphingobium barchaimii]KMS52516.1 ATPase [Novosphingobium barchaimii LL02]
MTRPLSNRFVVISGCSGGGKSTLLAELARRGHDVVEEPGRRVIAETLAGDGSALPWIDIQAFARRAIEVSLRDRAEAQRHKGWVFFDRGLIDAAVALEHASGKPVAESFCRKHRYHREVFLTPPWPEIYRHDADRRHDMTAALDEYERLLAAYPHLGYDVVILPKASVEARADFLLERLGA